MSTPPDPVVRPGVAVHSRPAALVLLGLLAVVWGVHWVVAKKGLDYMPPFTYAMLRVAVGLATVLVLAGLRGRLHRLKRQDVPIVLSVGILQVASGAALMNVALQVVPAGRSSILVYTMPIWVVVLQAVFLRVTPVLGELAGLLLGLAGIALLINPGAIDWAGGSEAVGVALLLLSAVIWAATSIHVRHHRWTTSPLDLQPWQLLAALVPLVVLALAVEPGAQVRWEPATVGILLYSGSLATAFAFWASQSITRTLGPLAATVGFLGVPVVGVASGAIFLGESLGALDLAGFALVATGILLVTRPRSGGADEGAADRPGDGEPGARSPIPAE